MKNASPIRMMLNPISPNRPSRTAKALPTSEAIFVARAYGRFRASSARRTRPPSMGNPGSMLNPARTRFIRARYPTTNRTPLGAPPPPGMTRNATRQTSPTATETTGPATAMRSSCRQSPGISVSRATPPKIQSVIDSIGKPCRIATAEWPSSCSTTPAKSPTAAASPSTQGVAPVVRAAVSTGTPPPSTDSDPAIRSTRLPIR
jgi:hypothetical protein